MSSYTQIRRCRRNRRARLRGAIDALPEAVRDALYSGAGVRR
jgi:hypothetical protein